MIILTATEGKKKEKKKEKKERKKIKQRKKLANLIIQILK